MIADADDALDAIEARITGTFDDPCLAEIGALTPDVIADISYIIALYR